MMLTQTNLLCITWPLKGDNGGTQWLKSLDALKCSSDKCSCQGRQVTRGYLCINN